MLCLQIKLLIFATQPTCNGHNNLAAFGDAERRLLRSHTAPNKNGAFGDAECALFEFDAENLVGACALGGDDLDGLSDFLADERARDR